MAGRKLYVSRDSGDSWTVYPFSPHYDGDTDLKMSHDGSTIAKARERFIYELDISHDYGQTWIENDFSGYMRDNLIDFDLSADGRIIAALHYGNDLKLSRNGGRTWSVIESGGGLWAGMDMTPNADTMVLLDQGYEDDPPSLCISRDGGSTWETRNIPQSIAGVNSVSVSGNGNSIIVSGVDAEDPFLLLELSGHGIE